MLRFSLSLIASSSSSRFSGCQGNQRASHTSMDGDRVSPNPTGALMRQRAQQPFAGLKDSALITRALVPPGPEPPPDNSVCHSPNPGPRRGINDRKKMDGRTGTGGGVLVADTSDPSAAERGGCPGLQTAGGRAGARGASRCVPARAQGQGQAGRPPCRAGSRATTTARSP